MKYSLIKFAFSFFFLTTFACAELIWSPTEGWSAKGPFLEPLLGKSLHIKDAEDAMMKGQCEWDAGHFLPALKAYHHVYKCYPNSTQAPEALYRLGCIYMQRHQYEDAFKSFQKIILEYPAYPQFNDVIAIQFDIASRLQRGARPYYWGIIPGFRAYGEAIEYFESIITNAPYTKFAPMALMNIADLAKEHKKPEDVIDALDRLISCYRTSELAACAYIKLADTYSRMVQGPCYDQGCTIRAINYYEDFLLLHPDDPQVKTAECKLEAARDKLARSKLCVGDFYYKYRSNCLAAKIYYNETITLAPNSLAAQEARQRLDCIAKGILPPPTICDRIFGRYQPPSTPAFLDEIRLERREMEVEMEETCILNENPPPSDSFSPKDPVGKH